MLINETRFYNNVKNKNEALSNMLHEWYIELLDGCAQTIDVTFDDMDEHARYFLVSKSNPCLKNNAPTFIEVKIVHSNEDGFYDIYDRVQGLEDWDYCDYLTESEYDEL